MSLAKDEAERLLEEIPEKASWDDIMYPFYVRKKIEVALRQTEAGSRKPGVSRGIGKRTLVIAWS